MCFRKGAKNLVGWSIRHFIVNDILWLVGREEAYLLLWFSWGQVKVNEIP